MYQFIIVILSILLILAILTIVIGSSRQKNCPVVTSCKVQQTMIDDPDVVASGGAQPAVQPATRDIQVLSDPLYPPVSRDSAINTRRLLQEPRLYPDADSSDSYRLVGYLTNREDKGDVWKLMARLVNRSQADFYAQSSNRNLDIKIPLTSDVVKSMDSSSHAFRDIYDLPSAVMIQHPMFSNNVIYDVVVLPRAQLASGYI
jgi:hypothetical protein